jgi:hypothetical protein
LTDTWDRVAVTLDVDWAPEPVLEHSLALLADAGVSATLFATHDSAVLRGLDDARYEVALHPRYVDVESDPGAPIRELLGVYPGAAGVRSHKLVVSEPILLAAARLGLRYEANHFLNAHPGLRPVRRFPAFATIPYHWSDDYHLAHGAPFEVDALPDGGGGLRVYAFHPIHVFMNTSSQAHYADYKPHYQDVAGLEPLRNGGAGVGTLFAALLEGLRGTRTYTLAEICDDFLAESPGSHAH